MLFSHTPDDRLCLRVRPAVRHGSCRGRVLWYRIPTGTAAMRWTIGIALLLTGTVMASAGDVTVRTHVSDDTLLRIGSHAFEGGDPQSHRRHWIERGRRLDDPPNVLRTSATSRPPISNAKDKKQKTGAELGLQRDQEAAAFTWRRPMRLRSIV